MQHTANKFKQQGNAAYKSADYHTALSHYSKAIQTNPNDPAFYLNSALCYFSLKNYQECITYCDKSLQLSPNYVKAMKKKASALVQLLKFEEALTSLKQAYAVEKTQATLNEIEQIEHYVSNQNKYQEALKNENYNEALSCVTYLVNKIPDNKQLKLIKIECLAKTGNTEEGLKELRAVDHHKTPETMYLKGLLELYSGDSAKAKTYFTQGIRLDPENTKCQKALTKANKCEKFKQEGNQLIKANNWTGAEAKYTQALNLDPYNKKLNAIIYSNRALTYMKRKMWIKAAEDLNRSIQLNPNYLKSYVKRAEVNMERGQFSDAIQDYAKVQQIDPKIDLKAKINEAKKKEKQAKKKDYYAILGVPKNAKDDEIKKAYKKMALKYHPDRNRNKSQVEQDQASKMFRDINQAQDILTDPEKRKLYDSGAMNAEHDMDGQNFSNFSRGNMGGFSGMGSNGQNFTFTMNGQQMDGIDPSQIFAMFMGGNRGGFGGFEGFGQNKGGNSRGRSTFKTSSTGNSQNNKFTGFNGFSGFDQFGF